MLLRHKHRHAGFWSPRKVPVGPVEIDWNHPLACGLIGCYVPGSSSVLQDLAGVGPTLLPGPSGFIDYTPEGLGYSSNNGNASAFSTIMPNSWQLTVGGTLFWRGVCTGSASIGGVDALIWGNLQNSGFVPSGSQSPNYCYGLKIDQTSIISFGYSAGTTRNTVLGNSIYSVQVGHSSSIAATFAVGGNIVVYAWGGTDSTKFVPTIATGTWSGDAPDYTQNPEPAIGCDPATQATVTSGTITTSAYLYDRVLTAQEIVMLDADPFAMLRPTARRLRNSIPTGGNPFRRWNRTYLIR